MERYTVFSEFNTKEKRGGWGRYVSEGKEVGVGVGWGWGNEVFRKQAFIQVSAEHLHHCGTCFANA